MNAAIKRWRARVDAMSLRERVFLFVSLALLLLALADQLAISSSLRQLKEWNLRLSRGAAELQQMRQELAAAAPVAAGTTSSAETRPAQMQRELAEAALERQQLLASLELRDAHAVAADALPQLLARVLQRHERVSLLRLQTRGASSGPGTEAGSAGGSSAPTPAGPQAALLSLTGAYPDLQAFLAELEQQLPTLRWGELQLSTRDATPTLTVQIWLSNGNTP
jgi:MSHA biogenesis protein MshJ